MSWIEGFRERERRRAEAQRQEDSRSRERQVVDDAKDRQKLAKDLAGLVKRYTGVKIGPPQVSQITSFQESGNNWVSDTSINGRVQVDGVWFGIAKTRTRALSPLSVVSSGTHDELVVFGKDDRAGEYKIVDPNPRSLYNFEGLLREFGYLRGSTSHSSQSSGDGYIGETGPTRGTRRSS